MDIEARKNLKVGDIVWVFDKNHRVYENERAGRKLGGGPIYLEYFVPREIIGETSRSWLLEPKWAPDKINKKTLVGIYASEREVDEAVWIYENGGRIGTQVGRLQDYDKLQVIAKLVGYPVPDKLVNDAH